MNNALKQYLFLIILIANGSLFAQQKTLDSLNIALKNVKQDTLKLHILIDLSEICDEHDIQKYALPAIEIADKLIKGVVTTITKQEILNYKARAYNNIGFYYYFQGNITQALENYNKSLTISSEIKDKTGIGASMNNIGLLYNDQGNITEALSYYEKSLKISEEINDKEGIGTTLNNIGTIYRDQGDLLNSFIYYKKSLKIREEIGDIKGMGVLCNNIGFNYEERGEINLALEYYKKCLKYNETVNDKKGIGFALDHIGVIYKKQRNPEDAMDCFKKSLKIQKEINDKEGITNSLLNIGGLFLIDKKYQLAKSYSDSSLNISRELGFPENIKQAEHMLSKIDSATGNYEGALSHYKNFIMYNDRINNIETHKASVKNQLKYEYEKKEAVIKEQQEKERAISSEKNRIQLIIIWTVILGLLMVVGFAIYVFSTLRTTRIQKIMIEKKQREILDSIHYAKRIQKSLLPTERYIDKSLNRLMKQ